MQTFVSILVTVYNREPYLGETLKSILASSFDDFELIITDDCSGDGSMMIASEIASNDPRIMVHVNNKNLGDYGNRNQAASFAKGKYLKYLDADDLIYRHSLATMVEAMEKFPEAALALSQNVIDPDQPYPRLYQPQEFFREHYFGKSPIGVGPSASIIRRECFDAVGGFSGRQFVGDTELWMKLAERWPIVTLPPALVWWRRHPGQQMQLELKRPEVLNLRYQLELDTLNSTQHLTQDNKQTAQHRLTKIHARRLLSLGLKGRQLRTACRLFGKSGLTISELLRGFRKS
ncbi:MAG TPA: glycosyltransferase family A protein [Planctomycetaceae bacterium]|nr:glycosyltransferase family A protein [Planctomycetaceae bacterium]